MCRQPMSTEALLDMLTQSLAPESQALPNMVSNPRHYAAPGIPRTCAPADRAGKLPELGTVMLTYFREPGGSDPVVGVALPSLSDYAASSSGSAEPLDPPPNAPTPSLRGGPALQRAFGRGSTTKPTETFDRVIRAAGPEFDVWAVEPADLFNLWVRRAFALGLCLFLCHLGNLSGFAPCCCSLWLSRAGGRGCAQCRAWWL